MSETLYKNWDAMSDKALAEHIGHFIKEKRLERNQTQQQLARDAGISRSTLSLLEKGEVVTLATLLQVLRVLDQLKVLDVFTIRPVISPMQVAEMEMKLRRRARGKGNSSTNSSSW
jgi:transcriptional regulator with XRE-family HTH domain